MRPVVGPMAARMAEISDSLSMLSHKLKFISQQAVLASPNEVVYMSFANHAAEASMILNMTETFRWRTHALAAYAQSLRGVLMNTQPTFPNGEDH